MCPRSSTDGLWLMLLWQNHDWRSLGVSRVIKVIFAYFYAWVKANLRPLLQTSIPMAVKKSGLGFAVSRSIKTTCDNIGAIGGLMKQYRGVSGWQSYAEDSECDSYGNSKYSIMRLYTSWLGAVHKGRPHREGDSPKADIVREVALIYIVL